MKQSQRTFKCDCGIISDRDIHAAQNMIEIAKMVLEDDLSVPVGRRELKREEFLTSYEKKFGMGYGTLIHEDHTLGVVSSQLNGDYFHANPKFYKDDDIIRIRKVDYTAKDIWQGDNEKRVLAESNGFIVKYLWENEMKNMNDNELLNWIKLNCL